MHQKPLLSEKAMFRLTADKYRVLVEQAHREQLSLSNLVHMILARALRGHGESCTICAGLRRQVRLPHGATGSRQLNHSGHFGQRGEPHAKRWLSKLVSCQMSLIVYDTDEVGRRDAQRLLKTSQPFRSIDAPQGKDITEFYLCGGDVYAWNEGVLTKASAT